MNMFWRCNEIQRACSQVEKSLLPKQETIVEDVKPGQDHVFAFQKNLTHSQKENLAYQFAGFEDDLGTGCQKLEGYFSTAFRHGEQIAERHVSLEPPSTLNWASKKVQNLQHGANLAHVDEIPQKRKQGLIERGYELYSQDKVAIVLLAGHAECRENPIALADIGLLSKKTIFQLYFEKILRLQHLVQRKWPEREIHIPIYVMCNPANRDHIETSLRKHDFFGVRERDIMFCTQSQHPVVDANGKMLLLNRHTILELPTGDSLFWSLHESGLLADMKSRGVRYLYVSNTNNVLAKIGDPLFIGHCEAFQVRCGVKCVQKESADEDLEIFCNKRADKQYCLTDDATGRRARAAVCDVSEVPEDIRRQRDGSDAIVLAYGSLSQYFFTVDFVSHVSLHLPRPLHVVDHQLYALNAKTGHSQLTDKGTCFRFEFRVTDAFEFADRTLGVRVSREEKAIVQRQLGSIYACKALEAVSACHQHWISSAGGSFINNKTATEQDDAKCEVSPFVSYDGEGLDGIFVKALPLPYHMSSPLEDKSVLGAASLAETSNGVIASKRCLPRSRPKGKENRSKTNQKSKNADYAGERASPLELLPPTPCNAGDTTSMKHVFDEYPDDDKHHDGEMDGDQILTDFLAEEVGSMSSYGSRRSKKSILGENYTNHKYGGSFLRNTGRFSKGARISNTYWKGSPNEEEVASMSSYGSRRSKQGVLQESKQPRSPSLGGA
jgi:UDP-N-acetylglucosamine/UDP-N-acetylgalactosamine diphosphorylase